jgi:hypothetical protein
MARIRRHRRTRAVLVAAFLLGALLCWGGTAAARAAEPLASQGERVVVGFAHVAAGAPVVGGRVRLVDPRGAAVATTAPAGGRVTSRLGTFAITTSKLPARFVVEIVGGTVAGKAFRGTLRAPVFTYRRLRIVHVNVATTLATAYLARHPKTGRAALERRVKHFLRIPRAHDMETHLRVSGRSFDGRLLIRRADQAGGFDVYVRALADEMGRRGTASQRFAPHRAALAPQQGRQTQKGAAPASPILDMILTNLATGALREIGGAAAGRVLSQLGFGGNGDLSEIKRQLSQIQANQAKMMAQLDQLEGDIQNAQASIANAQYTQMVSQLGPMATISASDIQDKLDWLLANAGACDAAQPLEACIPPIPPDVDTQAWCTTSTAKRTAVQATACAALGEIAALEQRLALAGFNNVMTGVGSDGLLVSFQKARYSAIRAEGGFVDNTYAAASGDVYSYYKAQQVVVAQYLTELDEVRGIPDGLMDKRIGDLTVNLGVQEDLLPAPLPPQSVIHPRTGYLWAAVANDGNAPCSDRSIWVWIRAPDPTCIDRIQAAAANLRGLPGWKLPTSSDIKILFTGWTGSSAGDWFAAAQNGISVQAQVANLSVPPPDTSLLPPWTRRYGYVRDIAFKANPGTAWGVHAFDFCPRNRTYGAGAFFVKGSFEPLIDGIFCTYVRLQDLQPATFCAYPLRSGNYFPCSMPVVQHILGDDKTDPSNSGRTLAWGGTAPPALDYGHGNLLWLYRPVSGAEGWYRAP